MRFKKEVTTIVIFLVLTFVSVMAATVSGAGNVPTFEKVILKSDPVPFVQDPFVTVFLNSPDDSHTFGFKTDGVVDVAGWKRILQHVGHISGHGTARDNKKLENQWIGKAGQGGQILYAAQELGLPTVGSVFRFHEDPQAILDAYATDLALNFTHFFHDDERDTPEVGPGGEMNARLRVHDNKNSPLTSEPSADFDTSIGGNLESFEFSFGFAMRGSQKSERELMSMGDEMDGFKILYRGEVAGQLGYYSIVFQTIDGGVIDELKVTTEDATPAISKNNGSWQKFNIRVTEGPSPDKVSVSLDVIGAEWFVQDKVEKVMNRPGYRAGMQGFAINNGPSHPLQYFDFDDIALTAIHDSGNVKVFTFTFEKEADGAPDFSRAIFEVTDSCSGHNLTTDGTDSFSTWPTSGSLKSMIDSQKRYLVDEILEIRSARGLPAPEVFANWKLHHRKGRLEEWKSTGLSVAEGSMYINENSDDDIIKQFLDSDKYINRWAWNEGGWRGEWFGSQPDDNGLVTKVLLPDQYGSLVTLSVLDGVRWFIHFAVTPHFSKVTEPPLSDDIIAKRSASVVQSMAQAASDFEQFRISFEQSEPLYILGGLAYEPKITYRARQNIATGELWFAAYSRGKKNVMVVLPYQSGTVTNARTGEVYQVTDSTMPLAVSRVADLYHFVAGN
jgi:hypothetical protein